MGFYDNQNFDGLKFLSQLKDKPDDFISEPCKDLLTVIKYFKSMSRNISVAEIGIGYGATTLQVLNLLGEGDSYYLFDFDDKLNALIEDLQARDFGITCEVVLAANSQLEWDSYNWNLSNLLYRMRERGETGMFDAAYLDGAHTLIHDGLAVCLLKELVKDGGYLILDDVFWSFKNTDRQKNYALGRLPEEQMADYQILRVRELFLDNDPNFESITPPNVWRAVFRKRSTK